MESRRASLKLPESVIKALTNVVRLQHIIPSLEWDKTNVIGKSRKIKQTDEEKNVLKSHAW